MIGGVSSVGWTPVALSPGFTLPVVACSVERVANTVPMVVRVQSADSSGFDVKIQNPSGAVLAAETVHCLVVEEGAWALPDGRLLEAHRFASTVTNGKAGSWVAEPFGYVHAYTSPVVLGQVMTTNDPLWSVFFAYGPDRKNPPTPTELVVGKHVGEDPNTVRAEETLGVIVVEAGQGDIGGAPYTFGVTADSVKGSAPYAQPLSGYTSTPAIAVVTQGAALDGGNGAWPGLTGPALSETAVLMKVDEDQLNDPERNHTHEQVSFAVFGAPIDMGGL